jgi:hypothetical protein
LNQKAAVRKAKDITKSQEGMIGQMGKGSFPIPVETEEIVQV